MSKSLSECLQALAEVKRTNPAGFDDFFSSVLNNPHGGTSEELEEEIFRLVSLPKAPTPSSYWKSLLPQGVISFVEFAKRDVISEQLLYDPDREEGEEVSLTAVTQAVRSGVLLHNVLDLSEQIISQHFGALPPSPSPSSAPQRVLDMSRHLVFGMHQRLFQSPPSTIHQSLFNDEDEEEEDDDDEEALD
ncbi:hypothetical protein BASA81_000986 [Batrachochytrium salamandrivorans]|nr:hypothetical protein BASA81_000986 [Batrachochytrium salamandrivorans]